MPELKPCPFCGGKARLIRKPIFSIDGGFMANDGSYHIVVCDTPSCASVGYYGREQEAIDAWNTRAERTCIAEENSDAFYGDCMYVCSECGADFDNEEFPKYCSQCGAEVVE